MILRILAGKLSLEEVEVLRNNTACRRTPLDPPARAVQLTIFSGDREILY